MTDPLRPADHPATPTGKTGVLLVHLGTPDAPTYGAVRRYLAEFLSDPRVVEMPKPLWLPILYGPILTFRPARSARAYAKVWNRELNESPLRTISRAQAEGLASAMGDGAHVVWAARYGNPSMEGAFEELKAKGCDRILIFALYPQYSATTVASVHDEAFRILKKMRWQPAIRTMPAFHDHAHYIGGLKTSVETALAGLDWQPEAILASYHSIPKAYWDKGDPYPCQCFKTTRLLKEALGAKGDGLISTFQSRVGPTEWVGPYTDRKVEELAAKGVKRILVLAPAFLADCLETLEEINMELRHTFLSAGGEKFDYVPCLNADPAGISLLETLTREQLAGWI